LRVFVEYRFQQVLLPCEDQYLRETSTLRRSYNVGRYDRLVPSLEREVTNLFEREVNFHVRLEKLKRELNIRYDWTARAAFETIDSLRDYTLNQRNIQTFLRLNGFIATDGEVIAIIRRLDSDGDNKVTLDEFAEALRPAVPLPSPTPVASSTVYEETKRASSPLRRTAASPLRATADAGFSQGSSANLAGAFAATQGSPARSFTASNANLGVTSTMSPSRRFPSPMRVDDESELVRGFKEQISLENELEDAKNRLALQPDFNLPDAFDLLDRHMFASLSSTELSDSLAANGVYTISEDVFLFVKRYDRNSDGRLNYAEFSDAFMPKSASIATTLQLRRAHYSILRAPRSEYFSSYTRELFFKTLRVHFSVESSAENLRRRLLRRPGFNASDAFAAVDTDRKGYITRDEFRRILREYAFFPTETEVQWLVDRYDRDRDGRVTYSEFAEEILPKSPSRR
jgi:Ca2+-binding EF-hand superfamily protein